MGSLTAWEGTNVKCGTAVEENVGDEKSSEKMKRCVCMSCTRGIFTVAERYGKIFHYSTQLLWQQGLMGISMFLCLMKCGAFDLTACNHLPLCDEVNVYTVCSAIRPSHDSLEDSQTVLLSLCNAFYHVSYLVNVVGASSRVVSTRFVNLLLVLQSPKKIPTAEQFADDQYPVVFQLDNFSMFSRQKSGVALTDSDSD